MTTILVVDDDPGIRAVIRAILEHEAYSIREAGDGREALRLAEEAPPDLVILDLMMPGVGGLEVLRTMKAEPRTAGVAIIVLTAMSGAVRAEAEAIGADGYFEKPFSPLALLRVVEETLAPRPAAG